MSRVQTTRLRAGALTLLEIPAQTLDEASLHLPGGAYTTLRTYRRLMALHLEQHLSRLEESAALEGQRVRLDRLLVRTAIAQCIEAAGFPESRFRLTVSYQPLGDLYISVEPFAEPDESLYRRGVRCALAARDLRRATPRAKSTSFIAQADAARTHAPEVNEMLLVGDAGQVLEGSSSNFFAVRNGILYTAGTGVLAGTTRGLVLQAAGHLLPVVQEPVQVHELGTLDEAFISSVSRGVLPVVMIEGQPIGSGVPGPHTAAIRQAYNALVAKELVPIRP